ncbi:MAG: hypothetical protein WA639_05840 [Candidatus Acidiferrum sp.]
MATWQQQFDWPGVGKDVNARYGNALDLQLGRDMHCWQAPNTFYGPVTACYVSNYGPAPFDSINQVENPMWPNLEEAVDEAIDSLPLPSITPFATVAMVYAPNGIGTNKDQVTFYVFDQTGNLLDNAALDGEGFKSVPRMCMTCHGGAYLTSTHSVTAAQGGHISSFLPFDVYGFYYSQKISGHGLDDQQESFRQLNNLVLTTNPNPAIANLINGLYSGNVATPGTTILGDSYVPSAWSANPTLYKGVFRKYCRMCHIAQDSPSDFSTLAEFGRVDVEPQFVCGYGGGGGGGVMPHAEVPFGGLAGSTKFSGLGVGFWWDFTAISDMNSFLDQGGNNPFPCKQP